MQTDRQLRLRPIEYVELRFSSLCVFIRRFALSFHRCRGPWVPGDGVGQRWNAVRRGPPPHAADGNNGRVCVDAHELGVEHVRRALGPGDVLAGHPDKNGGVDRRPASDGEGNPRNAPLLVAQRYTIATARRRIQQYIVFDLIAFFFSGKTNIPNDFQVVCPRQRRRSSCKVILGITRTLGKLYPAISLVLAGVTQLFWTFLWPHGCLLCRDDVSARVLREMG